MTLNDVIWRQACTIQHNALELISALYSEPQLQEFAEQIEIQTAIVLCAASCVATSDVSMNTYDSILSQVGQLQRSTWSALKSCADSPAAALARKLYDACANMKKRLRRKLQLLTAQVETTSPTSLDCTPAFQGATSRLASVCT